MQTDEFSTIFMATVLGIIVIALAILPFVLSMKKLFNDYRFQSLNFLDVAIYFIMSMLGSIFFALVILNASDAVFKASGFLPDAKEVMTKFWTMTITKEDVERLKTINFLAPNLAAVAVLARKFYETFIFILLTFSLPITLYLSLAFNFKSKREVGDIDGVGIAFSFFVTGVATMVLLALYVNLTAHGLALPDEQTPYDMYRETWKKII